MKRLRGSRNLDISDREPHFLPYAMHASTECSPPPRDPLPTSSTAPLQIRIADGAAAIHSLPISLRSLPFQLSRLLIERPRHHRMIITSDLPTEGCPVA